MATTYRDAKEVFGALKAHAEKNACGKEIVCPQIPYGQFIAQGDINIISLESIEQIPEEVFAAEKEAQLAPGTTRGSRHCIRDSDLPNVKTYKLKTGTPLHGPVLEVSAPTWIDHPEHKNFQLQPGIYAITYQRAFAEELRRIAD